MLLGGSGTIGGLDSHPHRGVVELHCAPRPAPTANPANRGSLAAVKMLGRSPARCNCRSSQISGSIQRCSAMGKFSPRLLHRITRHHSLSTRGEHRQTLFWVCMGPAFDMGRLGSERGLACCPSRHSVKPEDDGNMTLVATRMRRHQPLTTKRWTHHVKYIEGTAPDKQCIETVGRKIARGSHTAEADADGAAPPNPSKVSLRTPSKLPP